MRNILIVGAGSAGRLLARDIRVHHHQLNILGFVDDQEKGDDVLGATNKMTDLLAKYRIDEIIIAIPTTDGALVRKILLANAANRIPIRIVPRSQRVIAHSDVAYDSLERICSEDFLGRPLVRVDINRLKRFYHHKIALVTGGAGSIGSAVVRQLLDLGIAKVICYDHSEYLTFKLDQKLKEAGISRRRFLPVIGNIQNEAKVRHCLQTMRPDIIFHVAAYKHVYLMEENIAEAINNNILGTKIMADSAIAAQVPQFTFISTDKVVNPESVMGVTKKIAEYYLKSLKRTKTQFTIVRFGNVINSQGSVLPLFARQIKDHRYVTLTDKKMKRFFMSIREAAQLVIQSTAYDKHGGIFILNMGELINIYEAAECLIRTFDMLPGKDIAIKVIGRKGGEKLVEELYTKGEYKHLDRTDYENVWELKTSASFAGHLATVMQELTNLAANFPPDRKLRRRLKTLFPSLPDQ